MAAVVPLVPDKARVGAWGWLLRRRCTVAAVVSLVPDKAREEAWGWLLRRRCTAAGSTGYHSQGRLFAATATVLYRRRRCSVVRTVSHDNNDCHCTAAEDTGYHSRGHLFAAVPSASPFCLLKINLVQISVQI